MAKDVLPLVAACTSSRDQFPAYARERLQTTVRQTLGRPRNYLRLESLVVVWHGAGIGCLVLAAATAVVVFVALSIFRAPERAGDSTSDAETVGGPGTDMNELATLQGTWKESPVQHFPIQANWKRGRKTGPMAMDRPGLKSFTIL